jgi:hypothetical protein
LMVFFDIMQAIRHQPDEKLAPCAIAAPPIS